MKRPNPIDRPVDFDVSELFFSTTNPRGVIRSGNEVFVRISGYSQDELEDKPHSIIRHPDMPRIVFKVLWDYIQAGKPISAFVKNMARDGRYYWVVASVFPIPDGYLSIRLKPTSAIFPLIPDVYKKVLEAEQTGGMEAGLTTLVDILQAKGFENYDAFMSTMLTEELKSMEVALASRPVEAAHINLDSTTDNKDTKEAQLISLLSEISQAGDRIAHSQERIFGRLDQFTKLEKTLQSKSAFIITLAQKITVLSLNASIKSFSIGNLGACLSVVASEIQNSSELVKRNVMDLEKMTNEMVLAIRNVEYRISASKLQIKMIRQFISELLLRARAGEIPPPNFNQIRENCSLLIKVLQEYSEGAITSLQQFSKYLRGLEGCIEKLEEVIMTLEMVRKTGIIESAAIGKEGEMFVSLFEQMIAAVRTAREELSDFRQAAGQSRDAVKEMDQDGAVILDLYKQMDPLLNEMLAIPA